jgi:plasmid stabilization system protein ParE
MMKRFVWTMTTAAALFSAAHAGADPGTPVAKREVAALLDFVARSDCQFNRNGTWYDAGKARAHLQEKYDYLEHRGKVPNAEAFIQLAATQSSMSGKPYEVRCGNEPVRPSALWLSDELKRLRSGGR